MKKVCYNLLRRFCSNDGLRPVLLEPFIFENENIKIWCATDTRTLVIVPFENCRADVQSLRDKSIKERNIEPGRVPNVANIFNPEATPKYELYRSDLQSAISSCEWVDECREVQVYTKMKECPACDGDGNVENDVRFRDRYYSYTAKCPICHGYGKIPEDPEYDPDKEISPIDHITYVKERTGNKVLADDAQIEIQGFVYNANFINGLIYYMSYFGFVSAPFYISSTGIIQFIFPNSYFIIANMVRYGDVDTVKIEPHPYVASVSITKQNSL